VRILGHPTGRLLLRREPFALDLGAVLRRAAELGVAVEHNAAPERLDLNDRDLRLAKELGCKIVINSDSHDSRNLGKMEYGCGSCARLAGTGGCAEHAGAEDFLRFGLPHEQAEWDARKDLDFHLRLPLPAKPGARAPDGRLPTSSRRRRAFGVRQVPGHRVLCAH
jgi:hypothetical protein